MMKTDIDREDEKETQCRFNVHLTSITFKRSMIEVEITS